MVIEKVHGLQATTLSLNDRFTILATAAPAPAAMRQRRRPNVGSYFNQNLNMKNRNLMELIAHRLEFQAKRQAVKQRLGMLRRFGSESSLPGLRRSNSFGNLSQSSVKDRVSWRQSNGNLSRAASFANLQGAARRGFWRRGGEQRALRGRFRGGLQPSLRMSRTAVRGRRGRPRSYSQPPAARTFNGRMQTRGRGRGRGRGQGMPRGRGRGQGAPRGRGGLQHNQTQKPVPSKEELDLQLDQYMAGTRAALDRDLDTYMNNAMDLE